jgi:hypothetical protein
METFLQELREPAIQPDGLDILEGSQTCLTIYRYHTV